MSLLFSGCNTGPYPRDHGAGKPRAEHGVITRGVDHIHGTLRTSSRSSSSKRVRMASTTRESTTTHSRASSAKTSWRG